MIVCSLINDATEKLLVFAAITTKRKQDIQLPVGCCGQKGVTEENTKV